MDKVEKMDAQVQNNTTEIAVAKREKELQKEFFDKMTSNLKEYIDNKFTDIKELINAKHS